MAEGKRNVKFTGEIDYRLEIRVGRVVGILENWGEKAKTELRAAAYR